MICPKCKREVDTLHGNGEYPNSSYKCTYCSDQETGKVVEWFFFIIFWFCFLLDLLFFISGCATWTKADKTLLVASVVASYADYHTTTRILDDGGYEMNPAIGEHPSREKLAVFMISSEVLTIAFAHYFPKYRKVLLGGKTAVNGYCAIHNSGE